MPSLTIQGTKFVGCIPNLLLSLLLPFTKGFVSSVAGHLSLSLDCKLFLFLKVVAFSLLFCIFVDVDWALILMFEVLHLA